MIYQLSVGPINENVYIIDKGTGPLVVFDPGAEPERIFSFCLSKRDKSNIPILYIVASHGHLDHVVAIPWLMDLCNKENIPYLLFAPRLDKDYFGENSKATHEKIFTNINAVALFVKQWVPIPDADIYFDDGYILPDTGITVIHTPGHTRGSCCFLDEDGKSLIAGDTLFKDGWGRTDNFDGDEETLMASIRERLCTLDDDVAVLPGHGDVTTIGREKRYFNA
jgi:glyoxylase-like metal-dependent hydrolase (beta-lactamase superfamily II)